MLVAFFRKLWCRWFHEKASYWAGKIYIQHCRTCDEQQAAKWYRNLGG